MYKIEQWEHAGYLVLDVKRADTGLPILHRETPIANEAVSQRVAHEVQELVRLANLGATVDVVLSKVVD